MIRSQNVHDFYFSEEGLAFIDEEQARRLNGVTVEEGDVLLNITGDSIARVCKVPSSVLPARVNQHVSIIRCKDKEDSDFLLCYLVNLKPHLLQICGVGGTRNALTKTAIEQLPLFLPKGYRHAAEQIACVSDKIALNTRINAELEAMAKLLYDYWFVQFDFPNAKGKPYKSSGGAMVYNAELKREVPEGWEVKPLERIAHLIMGQSPKGASYNTEGNGMPLVNGAADYKNGMLAPETWTSEPTRTCIKDDLVFCSRATIGNLTIAEDTFCIGRCISAVRPTDPKASEFLFFGLLNELERFKRQAPGSIIKGITRDDLRDAPFLMPGGEVLKRYHAAAFPMFQKIRLNKLENQELTTLRDWLLPMLMNGQVVVGEAEENVGLAMAAEGQVKYGSNSREQ